MSSFSDLATKIHGITTVVGGAGACLAGVRERLVAVRETPTTEDIDTLIAELDADATSLAAAIANVPAPAASADGSRAASATQATGTGDDSQAAAPATGDPAQPTASATGTGSVSGNAA